MQTITRQWATIYTLNVASYIILSTIKRNKYKQLKIQIITILNNTFLA